MFEATPELLKITQINENGKEVNKAQLRPRNSRTVVTFGFSNPWGPLTVVLLVLVGTQGATGFLHAFRSWTAREKSLWTRVPEGSSQESETENEL